MPLPEGGAIPATGKTVTVRLCAVWRFRDGKIVSVHSYGDNMSVLQQLGVLPGAAPASV